MNFIELLTLNGYINLQFAIAVAAICVLLIQKHMYDRALGDDYALWILHDMAVISTLWAFGHAIINTKVITLLIK